MKSGILKIKAYRVSRSKGEIDYVSKVDDDAEGIWFTSLEEMAKFLKHEAELFHSEFRPIRVEFVIDLRPYHDIEHASDRVPLRCFALTTGEADEFWKHYNS